MKKLKLLTLLLIAIGALSISNVKATDAIVGKNVTMTQQEFDNLKSQGLSDIYILNISESEFQRLKDITGEVVSKEVKYYKTTYPKNNFYSNTSSLVLPVTEEITEEEYEAIGTVQTRGTEATYETAAKKIETSIASVSGNKYRYTIFVNWKTNPKVRSRDIIAISFKNNVKLSGSTTFSQIACTSTSIASCTSDENHSLKSTSTGIGASFKLQTGTFVTITTGLYFDVTKNTSSTITSQYAVGDYSHATTTVTTAQSNNYTLDSTGITLNSSVINYFDAMGAATATWTGSW